MFVFVCICDILYKKLHPIAKVRTFLGSDDILAGPDLALGLGLESGLGQGSVRMVRVGVKAWVIHNADERLVVCVCVKEREWERTFVV